MSDRNVDMIGDGVDCVIRGNSLPASSLIARRVAELEYVMCASPAYVKRAWRTGQPEGFERAPRDLQQFVPLTGKTFPLVFTRGDQEIEIEAEASMKSATICQAARSWLRTPRHAGRTPAATDHGC